MLNTLLIQLYIISCVSGLTVSLILFRHPKAPNQANKILSASILFLTLSQATGLLIQSKMILHVPHVYRLDNLFALLFMPLSWMYIRLMLTNRRIKWHDTIHLLPALIYVIDYLPFFFSSAATKLTVIQHQLNDLNFVLQYSESRFFPAGFHLWFRNFVILFYWLLQVRLMIRSLQTPPKAFITGHRSWMTWMIIYISFQIFICAPYFAAVLHYWPAMIMGVAIVLIVSGFSLIYEPVILSEKKRSRLYFVPEKESATIDNPNLSFLSTERLKIIDTHFEKLMLTEKPYLKIRYSIVDLSVALSVPTYQISFFLNHRKGKNFNDVLNEYRIEHSKQLMQRAGNQLTLEAIGRESGFGNRNSFTNAFKKYTGYTPSEFLQSLAERGGVD